MDTPYLVQFLDSRVNAYEHGNYFADKKTAHNYAVQKVLQASYLVDFRLLKCDKYGHYKTIEKSMYR